MKLISYIYKAAAEFFNELFSQEIKDCKSKIWRFSFALLYQISFTAREVKRKAKIQPSVILQYITCHYTAFMNIYYISIYIIYYLHIVILILYNDLISQVTGLEINISVLTLSRLTGCMWFAVG